MYCRYFARIADERMKPDDQVILVTHQPMWLQEWFKEKMGCHNLRQLVRCHLRGRARIHLAGVSHNLATFWSKVRCADGARTM